MRGRRYKRKVSILIIVSKDCELKKAARNLPSIDITEAQNLNVKLLAPNGKPGRLCLFTEAAIDEIAKKKLFM
jgi:large subunit ribosomal protein L4e